MYNRCMKNVAQKLLWIAAVICLAGLALYSLGIIGNDAEKYVENKKEPGSGFTYSGTVRDGKYDGFGEIIFDNEHRYEGWFSAGRFDGDGIFYSPGWYFQGTFSGGEAVSGAFYDKNGSFLDRLDSGGFAKDG